MRTWVYIGHKLPNNEYNRFANVFRSSTNSCASAGTTALIRVTSLYSRAVVVVACSRASIVSFMVATSSSLMAPTANTDSPFAAVLYVAVGLSLSHLRFHIINSRGAVMGISASSNNVFCSDLIITWFRLLSFCPFSFNFSNHVGNRDSSPLFNPHIASVVCSSVSLIPNLSSGLVCVVKSVGGVVPDGFILRSIVSSVAGVIAAGFPGVAGVPVCVDTGGNIFLNFSMAHWRAEMFTVVVNVVIDTCGFGSGKFRWTKHDLKKFLQWMIIGISWLSMLRMRSYITSASRSELKPSYTRNDGIGAHCMMSVVLSSVMVLVLKRYQFVGFVFKFSCVAVSVGHFNFLISRIVFGSMSACGQPIMLLPSPVNARILLLFGDISPMPLVPIPRPYITLIMFDCGMFTSNVNKRCSALSCVSVDVWSDRKV